MTASLSGWWDADSKSASVFSSGSFALSRPLPGAESPAEHVSCSRAPKQLSLPSPVTRAEIYANGQSGTSRKNRASVDYLRELRERLPWPIAVEFRGGGWMEAERQSRTLKLLEDLGLAYVSVDEPQGFPSSTPPVVACTSELAVLRLHGHNAENWEKPNITAAERFRYLYSEDELRGWVGPVRGLAEQK